MTHRFSALSDTPGESDHENTNKWDTTKTTYIEAAAKIFGHKKQEPQGMANTWNMEKNEEWKQLKIKMLCTESAP